MVDSVKTSSSASAVVQSEFQTIQLPVSVAVVEANAFKTQCKSICLLFDLKKDVLVWHTFMISQFSRNSFINIILRDVYLRNR